MVYFYVKIISFFCLLQLSLAADDCQPFKFLSSRSDDQHGLILNCFPPTNFTLECVQKILDERDVRNKIEGIVVEECEGLYAINGSEILKALDLKFVNDVEFKQKHNNERIERNVSAEFGPHKLELVLSHGMKKIDVDLLRSYEHLKELNLKITSEEVPDELISNLKQLKKLKYVNRYGGVFSYETLVQMPQLEYIYMDLHRSEICCNHSLIFKNMTNLKELDLRFFFDEFIGEDVFEGAYNLETLRTHNTILKRLPDNVFKDQINLVKLDLSFNELEIVQSALFKNLNKLKHLDLSNNAIGEINWEWPLLPSLEILDIMDNSPSYESALNMRIKLRSSNFKLIYYRNFMPSRIETTEAVVCANFQVCEFLEDRNGKKCPMGCKCRYEVEAFEFVIDCAQRNLTEIPELPIPNIGNVTLRIYHNHIKQLPDKSLYGYSNIANLYAGSNELTSLSLEQIPANIRVIDLNNNPLANINEEVIDFLNQRKNINWSWIVRKKCTLSTYIKNIF